MCNRGCYCWGYILTIWKRYPAQLRGAAGHISYKLAIRRAERVRRDNGAASERLLRELHVVPSERDTNYLGRLEVVLCWACPCKRNDVVGDG